MTNDETDKKGKNQKKKRINMEKITDRRKLWGLNTKLSSDRKLALGSDRFAAPHRWKFLAGNLQDARKGLTHLTEEILGRSHFSRGREIELKLGKATSGKGRRRRFMVFVAEL